MAEGNFNSGQDAPPPPQDKSAGATGERGADRIEAVERKQMQAGVKPKAADAAGTNLPADARREEQPVRGQHGTDAARAAGSERKAERDAITTLPNRVGFQFNSSNADQSEVQRVIGNMSPEQQADLKDPTATVILTGKASRAGDSEHNMELSQQRAENVAAQLRESGVKAQIQIFAYGEQEAMDVGQPDGADDRDFRSVNVDVLSGQQHEVQKQTNIFLSTEADFTQINTDPDGNLNQALHKDLPEFEKSSVDGYSYRFDDVVARETGNQLLRAEVEVMSGLQAQPSMFFPFNVVGRNGEQGIIRDGVYDLMNKPGQDAFLPPGSWPVRVIEVTPTSFTFETLQGHFDPAGSRITFSTWTDQKGDVHLEHHGVADSKNNPNVIYLFAPNMADAAWQRQSANLRAWMNMGGLRTAAGRAWLSSQKR